ncbi:hypothetical protein HanIR_Chr12g0596081 [Helianthus annuus]|nr:hypothetical protein HanIR_Chr12g0596081 [Helianthus annuus]
MGVTSLLYPIKYKIIFVCLFGMVKPYSHTHSIATLKFTIVFAMGLKRTPIWEGTHSMPLVIVTCIVIKLYCYKIITLV